MAPQDNDRDRLERKLAKLAALPDPSTPGGREIAAGPLDALLAAILTEIDETLLWRRLSFRTAPDGPALHLDVYGRRLVRLGSPLPAGLSANGKALADQTLDDDSAQTLREVLGGWLGPSARLAVRVGKPPGPRDPLAFGIAARTLAEAWGIPLDTGALPDPIAALDALVAAPSDAFIRLGADGEGTAGGAEEDQPLLEDFAQDAITAYAAPEAEDGKLPPPHFVAVGRDDGRYFVFAEASGEMVMMLASAGDLPALTRAWRSVVR